MIGLFVLVIAWINYVNLSTARALERAKEVGIRKVVGAIKAQLINQFLVEAAMVNLLSVILALLIVGLVIPFFNSLVRITTSDNGSHAAVVSDAGLLRYGLSARCCPGLILR